MTRWSKTSLASNRPNRWHKASSNCSGHVTTAVELDKVPPPPPASPEEQRPQRAATCRSYILQHYHSTGCAGGAFSWRAAMLNPEKDVQICMQPREYRATTAQDIRISKDDKRRGGGPRVGSFQQTIPGDGWNALPKYDYTTKQRSCGYNERMHVEWENHVDHILSNGGKLPTASVVAKAGFRSCAPCCRDMLALARPTGKTFIMVDLAEDDTRGTFHFAAGDQYLPVPKEDCSQAEVAALKEIVLTAQANGYESSKAICDAVLQIRPPIDKIAQSLYLGDEALLPPDCARHLQGDALIRVLHAEHFARLLAEYGASIIRDEGSTYLSQLAIQQCRRSAKQTLINEWQLHLDVQGLDLEKYATAAVAPLFTEAPREYQSLRRSFRIPRLAPRPLQVIDERLESSIAADRLDLPRKLIVDEDSESTTGASTAVPDDAISMWSDSEDPEARCI